MSALRACRFGDRWELVRDIDGIGRRVGILHDTADADRLIASEDLLGACKAALDCVGRAMPLSDMGALRVQMSDAIAKAEGKS